MEDRLAEAGVTHAKEFLRQLIALYVACEVALADAEPRVAASRAGFDFSSVLSGRIERSLGLSMAKPRRISVFSEALDSLANGLVGEPRKHRRT